MVSQKKLKKIILELAHSKRELQKEKSKNMALLINAIKPKQESDILNLDQIKEEYKLSKRTIYRYRIQGLKYSKTSSKGFVTIIRGDLEQFLKKDMYDR